MNVIMHCVCCRWEVSSRSSAHGHHVMIAAGHLRGGEITTRLLAIASLQVNFLPKTGARHDLFAPLYEIACQEGADPWQCVVSCGSFTRRDSWALGRHKGESQHRNQFFPFTPDIWFSKRKLRSRAPKMVSYLCINPFLLSAIKSSLTI